MLFTEVHEINNTLDHSINESNMNLRRNARSMGNRNDISWGTHHENKR